MRHLHRHGLFEGPFIPQSLFSLLAAAAGFGQVMDVRRYDRRELVDAPLGRYLSKTARTPNPLSEYFTKIARRPDVFNAMPKGSRRKRAPKLVETQSDWYWLPFEPIFARPPSGRDIWVLPDNYLPRRADRDRRDAGGGQSPGCVCLAPESCICGAGCSSELKARPLAKEKSGARSISDRLGAAMSSVTARMQMGSGADTVAGALARGPRPVQVRFTLHSMTDPNKRLAGAKVEPDNSS